MTLSASPEEGGEVSGEGTFIEGTLVTIKATPNQGYRFVSWNDGVTDNERSVWMQFCFRYTAIFEKDVTHVSSIQLDRNGLSILTGGSDKLTARILPSDAADKTIVWTVSDSSIATVDQNGNIKAISKGQTTVTVTTNDGGLSDTCVITVTENTPSPFGNGSAILLIIAIIILIIIAGIFIYVKRKPEN